MLLWDAKHVFLWTHIHSAAWVKNWVNSRRLTRLGGRNHRHDAWGTARPWGKEDDTIPRMPTTVLPARQLLPYLHTCTQKRRRKKSQNKTKNKTKRQKDLTTKRPWGKEDDTIPRMPTTIIPARQLPPYLHTRIYTKRQQGKKKKRQKTQG